MKFWYVYGAGGLGAETMDIIRHMMSQNPSSNITPAFLIDGPTGNPINYHPVISLEDAIPGSLSPLPLASPQQE